MNPDTIEGITSVITGLVSAMGLVATVEVEDIPHRGTVFSIHPESSAYMLIGHRGEHLHALEVLVVAMSHRVLPETAWFSLDVDDYKRKREWYLKETVQGAVEHLEQTGKQGGLVPMPSYERRFVHSYIQERYPQVESESVGVAQSRRIVLKKKSKE